jgi:hypothetical protein
LANPFKVSLAVAAENEPNIVVSWAEARAATQKQHCQFKQIHRPQGVQQPTDSG